MADRGQVLPFTLTELLALLFFALALALAFQWMMRDKAETRIKENEPLLTATEHMPPEARAGLATIIREGADSFPEDFEELNRRLQSDESARQRLQQALREAGVDSSHVDTAGTGSLIDSLRNRLQKAEGLAEALAQAAGMPDSVVEPLTHLSEELQDARDSLQMCMDDRTDTRNQLMNCQGRLSGPGGADHPPCWANEFGEIEYVYETTLFTNSVTVRAIWPESRSDDVREVPGMLELPGDNLSYQEFARRALPVFRWSQERLPECRFFVRIVDDVDGGKEAFKDALLTVERFFYKYLTN